MKRILALSILMIICFAGNVIATNPVIVSCPIDVWTKVATNIVKAEIRPTKKTRYFYTLRDTGGSAPADNTDSIALSVYWGVSLSVNPPVDVYVRTETISGAVRVSTFEPEVIRLTDDDGDNSTITSDGQLHVVLAGVVDTGNSTITTLGNGGVFTGTAATTLPYGIIFVTVKASHASATDGLSVQQSPDGTNWDNTDEITVPATTGKTYSFQPGAQYFRVVYTNGATPQTYFRLQTICKKTNSKPSSHRIADAISDEDDAELQKAVITGKNPGGAYVNFQATTAGNFKVSLEEIENTISTNSNKQLKVTNFDSSGNEGVSIVDGSDGTRKLEFDGYYPVPVNITLEHHKNHDGDAYESCIDTANTAVGSVNVAFKTAAGSTLAHMLVGFSSSDEMQLSITEGAIWTQGTGTAQTFYCTNRNDPNTSTVILEDKNITTFTANEQVIKNVTGISGGTVIFPPYTYNASLGASVAHETRAAGHEWIWKNDETYVIKGVCTDANCKISIDLNWYELTNE